MRNYIFIDDPAKERYSGTNTRSIQEMVNKKDEVKWSDQ